MLSPDKAGHTGTLDPMATGVLPVLLNRGVKASEFMLTSDKHYIATLKLGITTDTEDVTGKILTECDALPSDGEVIAAADIYRAKIIDYKTDTICVEVTGDPAKNKAFIEVMDPLGIVEMCRTGVVALERGNNKL